MAFDPPEHRQVVPLASCKRGSGVNADQTANIVSHVGHTDLHGGPGQTDGADEQVHVGLLGGERMLEPNRQNDQGCGGVHRSESESCKIDNRLKGESTRQKERKMKRSTKPTLCRPHRHPGKSRPQNRSREVTDTRLSGTGFQTGECRRFGTGGSRPTGYTADNSVIDRWCPPRLTPLGGCSSFPRIGRRCVHGGRHRFRILKMNFIA